MCGSVPNNNRIRRKILLRITERFLSYRSAAGFGVRLDGAMGDTGSIITPFYDSLLVKITTSGPTLPQALDRMHRSLREMRIRGVKTNIPFLENVIHHKDLVQWGDHANDRHYAKSLQI